MEIKKVKTLIVSGDGINADQELGNAFLNAHAEVTFLHINELIAGPQLIHQYDILAFPGGFSFGDEIRSGKVLSIKIKNSILDEIVKFKEAKKLIIGICNGFQILVQLNLFDKNPNSQKSYTLSTNDHGKFKNFWTKVSVINKHSPWLKDLESDFYLPVRHKEGRLFGDIDQNLYVLKYNEDINGSIDQVAGIVDHSGTVFGLMPHPEAALSELLQPIDIDPENYKKVSKIFKNAVQYSMMRGV